ncbi:MAG: 2-deoxy-D-gluconate 3-dehydrogenase [Saliniramus fredricksonii]|uniref:2-deoxy-D-gluconate 3-dehydrogenase n=1 Tax=Saliniramus fredricksonii TaxID=1653334 RepID=A0A0P7X8S2_9HYPH|nr:SDR family oxidoreductase [Saliniramus fredricksonii]KPQ11577.1 MAG: 2-deoxy-D-gluconate 3-dehydrogenase [Saliniramus fredricksonii]SCC82483.1 NAD(P)-dependent dehydrogenase, short-chain alcohol dehydrogenase family [Saliniramus fredricksonii]SCC82488.1 NAD(P)-dependent dehydrogenase, short-chain alcohol dehydrogenase family [Saliniramus fredricksonii]
MEPLPRTPSFSLDGRRALVTGAGRGIGLAAACALAQAGASVDLVARSGDEITALAEALGKEGFAARAHALDVTDIDASAAFVAENGPYDILVNNAGMNRPAPLTEMTPADYDAVTDLNVRAAYFLMRAVVKGMITAGKGGSIINMSSQMGHVGGANRTVYCATKHAMEGFTKALAWEVGKEGIRVNTLCPTFIRTPMTAGMLADPAFEQSVVSKIALGRVGEAEDLMGAVVFLASDASRLVTGTSLLVDGGWTAQ